MNRLTEKLDRPCIVDLYDKHLNLYEPKGYSTDTEIGSCLDKLGKLEDLEEQIELPLEEMKRIDTCLKLATGNSVSCFNYKGKTIACMSVEKYNELLSKDTKKNEEK